MKQSVLTRTAQNTPYKAMTLRTPQLADTPRLQKFVSQLDALLQSTADEAAILASGKPLLAELVAQIGERLQPMADTVALLAQLHALRAQRPDLRLIVTSATIETQRFAEYFGGAPVIEVSGRTWPVASNSVRALRARRGMTRKATALAADVSERHLANLEYGTGNASILILLQVAQALQCSIAELVGDVTTRSPEWLLLRELLENRDAVWFPFAIHEGLESRVGGWLNQVRARVRYGALCPEQQRDLCAVLDEMRLVKDAQEQDTMRRAAQISARAHIRAMQLSARMLRAGQEVREYHLDAELLHKPVGTGIGHRWCAAFVDGTLGDHLQLGQRVRRQHGLAAAHHRRGRDVGGVVQGDAGDREQQHADQADRRADPVSGVQLLQPPGAALLLRAGRRDHAHARHRGDRDRFHPGDPIPADTERAAVQVDQHALRYCCSSPGHENTDRHARDYLLCHIGRKKPRGCRHARPRGHLG